MEEFCKYRKVYTEEQESLITRDFARLEGQCYLEHAGATLYSEKQIESFFSSLSKNIYANPHARNHHSKATEDAIDILRYQILLHFNTSPEEYSVIFTSGATAAIKLVGECFNYKDGSLVYLQDNHTSVLGMRQYANSMFCLHVEDAFKITKDQENNLQGKSNSLFVFPAQSNFSGTKYPLWWIERVKNGALNSIKDRQNWFVFLDAACYASTNALDLSLYGPDFVAISFYKMFGYPTGLGALLVRNESCHVLEKKYFGGGTVLMAQSMDRAVVLRNVIHERFEDGSLPFLSILALKHGFDTIKRLDLTFETISKHTFSLAQYVYRNLISLRYPTGRAVAILYHNTKFCDSLDQGGIVNFNLLRENGEYIGYSEVLHFANLHGIQLRTGCFCNPGACQYFLGLTSNDVKRHFEAGHVCGDQHDLVDGYPTGSVRISFGYMSTKRDADTFLEMILNCFTQPGIKRLVPKDEYERDFDSFKREKKRPINSKGRKVNRESNNTQSVTGGVLQEILLYPIKSCGAFSVVDKWPITPTGLKYDRQWMIVNSSGVCLTQKHIKQLCLVRPVIDLENATLILSYPDQNRIFVPINKDYNGTFASLCQSKVCGDKIQGWDCGDGVAEWLSDVLDYPGLRLLKQCIEDDVASRTTRKCERLQLSLANKAQYLLINEASVSWVRDKISQDTFSENLHSTVLRFRPNFVVKFTQAFIENDYSEFILDNLTFENGGKCTRCQMICIDQESGSTSQEPLQTLSREFKGKISFGVYLNKNFVDKENFIHVGCNVVPDKLIQK